MGSDFAGLLTQLKIRSGLTFAELAARSFTTRSTVHRYCSGATLPKDYAVVVTIATVCGATPAELTELARLWTSAQDLAPPPRPGPARGPTPGPAPPGLGAWPGLRTAVLMTALSLVTLLITGADTALPGAGTSAVAVNGAVSAVRGDDRWTWYPSKVSPAEFGVTMNSNTGAMPGFRVGTVRFWDSRTRWADLEPAPGRFAWDALDRLVTGARSARLPALFVFGGTPGWAAPAGPKSLYTDESRTSPPDDLADWDAFVAAVAARYRGEIAAYELWDTANDSHFYSGSVSTLVAMTQRAARIVRAVDPAATIVCPSLGHLSDPDGLRFLTRFAQLGGYQACDVVGLKLRQRPAGEPPEVMLTEVATAQRVLHDNGVGDPMWNTGPDFDVANQPPVPSAQATAYAARFFLVGLYGLAQGLQRSYAYSWGGANLPIVLQVEGEAPTPAALAIDRIQQWVLGTAIRGCGHGPAVGLPDQVWECDFVAGGATRVIRWSTAGAVVTPAVPGQHTIEQLDGPTAAIEPGRSVAVSGQPVLIEAS